MDNKLNDARILIVEDEAIIAFDIMSTLLEAGASIVGPVGTVSQALQLISTEKKLSAAVLDVRLGADTVWTVAEALAQRGVPFVFHTAHGEKDLRNPDWMDRPILEKPATSIQLLNAVASLLK